MSLVTTARLYSSRRSRHSASNSAVFPLPKSLKIKGAAVKATLDRLRKDGLLWSYQYKLGNGLDYRQVDGNVASFVVDASGHIDYLRGDGTVTYQELMEVFDKLKAAGVQNVGLVTRMEGER